MVLKVLILGIGRVWWILARGLLAGVDINGKIYSLSLSQHIINYNEPVSTLVMC